MRGCSFDWLVFLSGPEGKEGSIGDLHDLESDSWNISNSMSWSSESRDEYFIIIIDESQGPILRDESSNFLVVLSKLDSDALSDGGVRLFGLDGDFLNNNSWSLGGVLERKLPDVPEMSFLVFKIGPSVQSSGVSELSGGSNTSWFVWSNDCIVL